MSEKLTNDELYRKLLLEWFDRSKGHPLMGMGSLTATRHNELKHLIESCRPTDDKEAAGDITYAKLNYDKPPAEPERRIGMFALPTVPGGYCIARPFECADWKKAGK